MVKLMHKLLEAADNGKFCRVLLVDFSKAFDRIDHNILIRKMIEMEIPNWLTKWTAGFLTNRWQRVKYKNIVSEWKQVGSGVPQGTKFGPLGFIILINSMSADMKFVDDSTLYEIISNTNDSSLSDRGQELADWSKAHNMILNPTKTVEMRVNFKKGEHEWPSVIIDNITINQITSTKLLGFHINDHLNWNNHIDDMLRKANKRLHVVRLLLHAGINKNGIINFFNACIRSVLEYGTPVWNFGITSQQETNIESIQRRFLKMMDNISPYDHDYDYTALLQKYKLKSLTERRTEMCKALFLKIASDPDHPIAQLIPRRTHQRNLRSETNFVTPNCRTARFLNSFIPSSTLLFR